MTRCWCLPDLPGQKLDQFLNAMRKQKIPKINLKAMLTEHNVKWDSMTLHDELAREHEAMNKKIGICRGE